MNAKYARLANGQIEYAPDSLVTEDGIKVNPSAASYLAAGWKRVVDDPPTSDAGKEAKVTSWREDATTVTAVYKQVASGGQQGGAGGNAVPGRRIFSKLKILAALKEAGKWVLVKAWLEEKAYYDFYLAAQEFAEDYPLFAEAVAALKEYTGMDDAGVEEILAKCVAD